MGAAPIISLYAALTPENEFSLISKPNIAIVEPLD